MYKSNVVAVGIGFWRVAEAETDASTAVLDASALLAHLNDEEGASAVREVMKAGAGDQRRQLG